MCNHQRPKPPNPRECDHVLACRYIEDVTKNDIRVPSRLLIAELRKSDIVTQIIKSVVDTIELENFELCQFCTSCGAKNTFEFDSWG